MKKVLTACLALALTAAMGTTAFACRRPAGPECVCGGYVDADSDGLCDHWRAPAASLCAGCGSCADIDGDGLCDDWENRPAHGRGGCHGGGRGGGRHHRR